MKLRVVAVGDKMPAWVGTACDEYLKRMRGLVELVEIKPEKRSPGRTVSQILTAENKRISAQLPSSAVRVVLDERGEAWSTKQLATNLAAWLRDAKDVAFVIGGADGLAPELKHGATLFSLSALTLPHALARVILLEQLYRAFSMFEQHPYHRV